MKITVEHVMRWKPCHGYPEARIRELLGEGKTPLEIAELPIPVEDRVWALAHRDVLGDEECGRDLLWICQRAVRRAIHAAWKVSDDPVWRSWARDWVQEINRRADAAAIARNEAEFSDARDAAEAARLYGLVAKGYPRDDVWQDWVLGCLEEAAQNGGSEERRRQLTDIVAVLEGRHEQG